MERQIEGKSVVFIISSIIKNSITFNEANLLCSADYLDLKYYDSQHPLHAQQP